MVSSLHVTAGQFGAPSYPDFATHFNEAAFEPTRLELDGVAVGGGDLDVDGLPDDWELLSLQTLTHNGTDDLDGDRASNLAEFRAGTDPLDGTSALRVAPVQRDSAGPVVLRFPHAASRRYAMEFTENLSGWQRVTNAPLLYLDPGTAQWTDDGSLTGGLGPKRFYRVSLEQP
jgi:hypothetical protein